MPPAVDKGSVCLEPGLSPHDHRPGSTSWRILGTTFFLSIAVILIFAASNFFIQDDGFITLRYARNIVLGHGPVWHPGSTEFGYTNFLFMALAASLMVIGLGPISAATTISLGAFLGSALLTYRLVRRLTSRRHVAACCVLTVFLNFTVSSYATGLLETSLQVFFVLLTYTYVLEYDEEPNLTTAVLCAVAASLAVLTRLDSVLLLIPAAVYMLLSQRHIPHIVLLSVLPTCILGGFLLFCWVQYGVVLPNTFYAKAGESNFQNGLLYVAVFFLLEILFYIVLFSIIVRSYTISRKNITDKKPNRLHILLFISSATLWITYVLYVGGGFMGFRLMVPFVVFSGIAAFLYLAPHVGKRALVSILAATCVTSYLHHWAGDETKIYRTLAMNSQSQLHEYVALWAATGRRLHALLYTGQPDDPIIATTAADAIPFYSRLPAVDMHGLNDLWVARNGDVVSNRPGHQRKAPLSYLIAKGANLIIDHPRYQCGDRQTLPTSAEDEQYAGVAVVLVPISKNCALISYYLTPHPRITALIADGSLQHRERGIGGLRDAGSPLSTARLLRHRFSNSNK